MAHSVGFQKPPLQSTESSCINTSPNAPGSNSNLKAPGQVLQLSLGQKTEPCGNQPRNQCSRRSR